MYNSLVFSIFIRLCNHYNCLIPVVFHHSKRNPILLAWFLILHSPAPWQPLIYMVACFYGYAYSGRFWHYTIYGWSFVSDFIQHNALRFIHDVVYITSSFLWLSNILWFRGSSSGKEPACQCRRCKFIPWVRKIPWRRKWQPTPFLAWEIPCTEKSGRLQTWALHPPPPPPPHQGQRIGHNLATEHNILWYGYSFCLSIHQLIDIWVVSILELLWIILLQTFVYNFLLNIYLTSLIHI